MFDTLYRAARAATNTALLPVSVAADVVTLGGAFVDRDESYTASKVKRIARDGKKVLDDLAS